MEVLTASLIAYISTNIDDLLILTALFAGAGMTWKGIFAGRYIGMLLLLGISLLGALGLGLLDGNYLRLLGIVPILLGIKAGWEARTQGERKQTGLWNSHAALLNAIILTIGSGADNIGIYIPLFSGYSSKDFAVVLLVFSLMSALWCYLGYRLANFPVIQRKIQLYGHILVPAVFIMLGIMILWE